MRTDQMKTTIGLYLSGQEIIKVVSFTLVGIISRLRFVLFSGLL